MVLNWRQALLAQARADYDLYLLLTASDAVPVCYRLEMLQKSLEKSLKALSNDGLTPPMATHEAFNKVFRPSAGKHFATLGRALGCADPGKWESYVDGLKTPITLLESLVPRAPTREGIYQANSEYPWEEREFAADGAIRLTMRVPAQEPWAEWVRDAPRVTQLQRFLEACFEAESA